MVMGSSPSTINHGAGTGNRSPVDFKSDQVGFRTSIFFDYSASVVDSFSTVVYDATGSLGKEVIVQT